MGEKSWTSHLQTKHDTPNDIATRYIVCNVADSVIGRLNQLQQSFDCCLTWIHSLLGGLQKTSFRVKFFFLDLATQSVKSNQVKEIQKMVENYNYKLYN